MSTDERVGDSIILVVRGRDVSKLSNLAAPTGTVVILILKHVGVALLLAIRSAQFMSQDSQVAATSLLRSYSYSLFYS